MVVVSADPRSGPATGREQPIRLARSTGFELRKS
jgi:hypothetical protein